MIRDGMSRPFFILPIRGSKNHALFRYPTTIYVIMSYVWFS
uniref:Uncharacterized protein n=1 Tax=Siphoviridae sp. ctqpo8 TaxID=2826469 RepID=A0A8S5M364_9CAUD|nr:MAG TPA: hypothetical protein [Siphoviridae sp. ctqpo8]